MMVTHVFSSQYFVRSTRLVFPTLLEGLSKGSDPDRIKGALYVLGDKATGKLQAYSPRPID